MNKMFRLLFICLSLQSAFVQAFVETPWNRDIEPGEWVKFEEPVEIPLPAPLPSSEYRLHVGDILLISVYGEPGTAKQVYVDPRGMISYLFLDSIPAVGMTISEIREDLEGKLSSYYRNVLLSLTPVKFSAEYYTIAGEVLFPGRKVIVGKPTVLSALSRAGGLTLLDFRDQYFDGGDLDHAFLARQGQYVPVDFPRLIKQGDLSQDIPLQAGDYIYIPSAEIHQIFILGEVYGATTLNYLRTMSLAEALAEAGGVTELASNRALVIRGSLACPLRFLVDYTRILKGQTCDFALLPGDIVYVPPRRFQLFREIFLGALSSFVSTVASAAGVDTFIRIQPKAAGNENIFFGNSGPIIIP